MTLNSSVRVKVETFSARLDKVYIPVEQEASKIRLLLHEWNKIPYEDIYKVDRYGSFHMERYLSVFRDLEFLNILKGLTKISEDGYVTLSSNDLEKLVEVEKIETNPQPQSQYLRWNIDRIKREIASFKQEEENRKNVPSKVKNPDKEEAKEESSDGQSVAFVFGIMFALGILIYLFS